jgi:MATE family multidrug resistance protein
MVIEEIIAENDKNVIPQINTLASIPSPIQPETSAPVIYGSNNDSGAVVENKTENTSYKNAFKESLSRAAPYCGSQAVVIFADTLFVVMLAKVSDDALAASNMISAIMDWFLGTAGGAFNATSILVSKKIGEGDSEELHHVGIILRQSWSLALLLSLPNIAFSLSSKPILAAFDQPDEVTQLVSDYLTIIVISLPVRTMLSTNRRFTLATGHPLAGFIIDLVGRAFNIGLAYTLIFGELGLEAQGIKGLAIANTISIYLTFIASTLYLCYSPKFKDFKIKPFHLIEEANYYKDLWKLGWPIALRISMELGVTLATSFIIGSLGKDQLAADEAAFQYVYVVSAPMYSLVDTTSALVSKALGENKLAYTQKLVNANLVIGITISLMALTLFLTIPNILLGIFVDDDNQENDKIISIAKTLLFINGITQIFDSIRNIYSGSLNGYKDSLTPTLVSMFTTLVINLPLAFSLTYKADLEAKGTIIARSAGIGVGSVLMAGLWYKRYRKSYLPVGENNASGAVNDAVVNVPEPAITGLDDSSLPSKHRF